MAPLGGIPGEMTTNEQTYLVLDTNQSYLVELSTG